MGKQEQMKYHKPEGKSTQYEYDSTEAAEQAAQDAKTQKAVRKAGELAVETTDELLNEIDEILQVEEEFVIEYRQKGGQ